MMTSADIRQTFLNFFKGKGHTIVPSAPMVIKNDPTLMFTNAGMNQFKDLFLGNSPVVHPRIADTQKCLRVSGKHNDLEEVGVDTYHHTMFEMLGNWSFGDYFKKEAIAWSWELLADVYNIPQDRLYVTVFEGSADDKLPFDQEAYDNWKKFIAEDRILKGNKKDNFWEMGDTGPCGPCSEVHVDIRSDEERKKTDGKTLVNTGHPEVIEIWNNVFMEFNRKADGSLEKLPAQHVDTGMGLERLCMVLQGKRSNYDTDVFTPVIARLEKISGKKYGSAEDATNKMTRISMRVCADHIRAIAFAVTDGQLPSNTGAGYVIRRILRRAVRYGYQGLELQEPFMHKLIPALCEVMGSAFPELVAQQDLIVKVIREEETSFYRTLENGIRKMETVCADLKKDSVIPGKVVFELYDTFGFPDDLTSLIAREKGLRIDEKGFHEELQKQKDRSRAATQLETGDWVIVHPGEQTEFVGYDVLESKCHVLRYREVMAKGKKSYQLVLDKTPFYAEGGGQVGDKGELISGDGKMKIFNTRKENNLVIHETGEVLPDLKKEFDALVNEELRKRTASNHSATHLLHEALRSVLGTHVEQKGSLVNADYLRFDFSHFSKMTDEELETVEQFVNDRIRKGIALSENRNMNFDEARATGAMALFGEKYGDTVRVIRFGDSVELCGGTHVQNTAEIGLFKIVSESAVAAGIRRIEAITGHAALQYFKDTEKTLNDIKAQLKNPKDPVKAITDLQHQHAELQKKIDVFNQEKAKQVKSEISHKGVSHNGINLIAQVVDLDNAGIKDVAFQLKNEMTNTVLLLATAVDNKPSINVMVTDDLVKDKKLHAGNLVKELAKCINGGGGGQPFFATAGGTNAAGLPQALDRIRELI